MFENLSYQIRAILGLAAVGGGLMLLSQPLIVAFIKTVHYGDQWA